MLPVLLQALVCTLFEFIITEVRCQLHYTSAKSWILIKGPGVAHPLGCFQNDHKTKLREKLLPARNTQYLYCKSITGEISLHQHLHTMCCRKNTRCALSFYLYVLLLCSWCWGRIFVLHTHACGSWSPWSDQDVVRSRAGAARPPSLCLLFPAPLASSAVVPTSVFAVNQAEARLQLKNNLAKKKGASSLLQTFTQPTDCPAGAVGGHCKGELALTSCPPAARSSSCLAHL